MAFSSSCKPNVLNAGSCSKAIADYIIRKSIMPALNVLSSIGMDGFLRTDEFMDFFRSYIFVFLQCFTSYYLHEASSPRVLGKTHPLFSSAFTTRELCQRERGRPRVQSLKKGPLFLTVKKQPVEKSCCFSFHVCDFFSLLHPILLESACAMRRPVF